MINHYMVLGLDASASRTDIRKAYFKLALIYHPDKNSAPEAKEKFQQIRDAYKSLTGEEPNNFTKNELEFVFAIEEANSNINNLENFNLRTGPHETVNPRTQRKPVKTYEKTLKETNRDIYDALISFFSKRTLVYSNRFEHADTKEILQKMVTAESRYQALNLKDTAQDSSEQIDAKAFLWQAKKAPYAPLYILGSMHKMAYDPDDIFGDCLKNVLDQVEVVFTECELSDEVSTNEFYHFDYIVAKQAALMNKKLKCLESNLVIRLACERAGLASLPSEQPSNKQLKIRTEQYLTHVSPTAETLSEEKKTALPHIIRNQFWMASILSESEQGHSSLVVCGSLHNCGKWGLPHLLKAEGYKVIPIIKAAPTPRSTLVRALTYGSWQTFFSTPIRNVDDSKATNQEGQDCGLAEQLRKK